MALDDHPRWGYDDVWRGAPSEFSVIVVACTVSTQYDAISTFVEGISSAALDPSGFLCPFVC